MPKVNKSSPIEYVRPEVVAMLPEWLKVDDCCAGQTIIKKKTTTYLPKPNCESDPNKDTERYKAYLERAVFYNVTGRTLRGLCGMVFAKDTVVELPELLEILKDDVDGGNSNLEQQARETLSFGLKYGRAGLLTDYPVKAGNVTTRKEQIEGEVKPTITLYAPYQIINWRTALIRGKIRLTLLVLKEEYTETDNGFETAQKTQYRVLRLNGDERVFSATVEIYRIDTVSQEYKALEQPAPITDSAGKPFEEIPFTFVGSDNNLPEPNQPPLLDLANLNIAHYRNSADYEENSFMVGQATPIWIGVTEEWNKRVLNGKVQLGARGGVALPTGGKAELLQAEANSVPFEAMEHKEKQMVALGARLVQDSTVQRTATEASADKQAENSVLANTAANVSDAYKRALQWAARFVGAKEDDIKFELNRDFAQFGLTAQEITALIAAWQSNIIAKSELRELLRRARVATLDDDAFEDEIEQMGADLGAPVKQREHEKQDEQDALNAELAKKAAAKKGAGK